MVAATLGWDIGGAHLKAVLVDVHGKVQWAKQLYCPLWRGLHELEHALDEVMAECDVAQHVVTMTGELTDIFINRREGVLQISQCLNNRLFGKINFYAGRSGIVSLNAVEDKVMDIASMNWLASVQFIAKNVPNALFVDIGSTTTDIAKIQHGQVYVQGFDDATRMQSNELIYTGVVRTPLMALAQRIQFQDMTSNVAAEYFATTADIYTLIDALSLNDNIAESADGEGKKKWDCARRIARMVGQDVEVFSMDVWHKLAYAFKYEQSQLIRTGMQTHLAQLNSSNVNFSKAISNQTTFIVGCGVGSFLAREIATELGYLYRSVEEFIYAENEATKRVASVCFPAYAVAMLGLMSC